MPAGAVFVTGRSGSGKSRCLHQRISELLSCGESVALIVPEQFTFETERRLAAQLGGLMGVSVYSFTTLAQKVLKESGCGYVFLSRQGRRMVVRKTASEHADKLSMFARVQERPGFAEKCDELFTMFKRFEIQPEALQSTAGALPDPLFRRKLSELALLYSNTESYLAGRYMDTEDIFRALIQALPHSSFANANIMIDGFDMLTEQLYRVMETLLAIGKSVYISFRMDTVPCRDRQVFAADMRSYARLYAVAASLGCKISLLRTPVNGAASRHTSPPLMHLEHEAFAFPFKKYGGAPDGIRLFAATGIPAECEAAAEAVLGAAQAGLRYRDMAVVVTESAYLLHLARAFRKRGIPYFSDAAHPLSAYPAPRLISAALRCAHRGYTLPCLMELLRTGLAGVSDEDADVFENYALARGVRGTAFTKPFASGAPHVAEAVRAALIEPLIRLRAALSASPDAANKAAAVFDYMQELQIYQSTAALSARLRAEGRLELMEESSQVYRNILTVLDQLHAIMGDGRISTARFAAVLQEGFDAYEISAIPATADQVLLGSVGKTRSRDVRALFILGANEGSFPHYANDDGMISDEELSALGELGLNKWDSSADRADVELADVYCAISKPSELLYLSYTMSAGADAALPAPLIDRIRDIFPTLTVATDLEAAHPRSVAGGFDALASGLRAFADTAKPADGLAELYAWYASRPACRTALERVEDALYYRCSPEPFGHELSLKLYGNTLFGSATRLETYNGCPFRHFVSYGLNACERREYKERRADEGAFCHAALEAFVRRACQGDIRAMTQADCERLLSEILPEVIASHNGGVLTSTSRMLALCARLVRTVKSTAFAIVRQAKNSGFVPTSTEVVFGAGGLPALTLTLPGGESYLVGGRIDRIDGCTVKGEKYFRVVDYKTGAAAFDYTRLYHGLSLQLPLYIAAVSAVEKTARAAGMYYMHVADPVTEDSDAPLEKRLVKEFRLNGLTLNDVEVIAATAGSDPDGTIIPTGRSAAGFASESELASIMGFAKKRSAQTLSSIFEGGAEVSPAATRDRDECRFCQSKSICGFDTKLPGCAFRKLERIGREDFFKAVAKEAPDGVDD